MTTLARLPIGTLRLIQRTISAGLRAFYRQTYREHCGRSITQVSSLHFLIHFVSPKVAFRRIDTRDLVMTCGFHPHIALEDAMRTLLRLLRDHRAWREDEFIGSSLSSHVMANDLATLQLVPWKFWDLCKQILNFRLQRPANLPVSIRCLYSWNLNSWYPDNISNAHKSWVVRSLLKTAPVLLQETKWTQVQLQHLAHAWPDIRVAATLAKQDPNPQAGVAILFPPGWITTQLLPVSLSKPAKYGLSLSMCHLTANKLLSVGSFRLSFHWIHILFSSAVISIAVTSIILKSGTTF